MKIPLVTIVTVVYNGIDTIEKTITSIISQKYSNFEFIIQDGGSIDGTIDIIKKYGHYISSWESRADNGIYDAMNKAILKAKGDWIIFMNSGDTFVDENVLKNVFKNEVANDIQILYGNVQLQFGGKTLKKDCTPNGACGLPHHICHQATFSRGQYLKDHLYDTSLKICADYKLAHDYFKEGGRFLYKEVDVANYEFFGFSYQNLLLYFRELCIVTGKKPFLQTIKIYLKWLLCKCLPSIYKTIYYNKLVRDPRISIINEK